MKKKIIVIILVCAIVIGTAIPVTITLTNKSADKTIQALNEKYIDYITSNVTPNNKEYPIKHSDNGDYFEDIDYEDQNISDWALSAHLDRLSSLTITNRSKVENDESYRAQMIALLDYWINNDFQNPNWWYNQIGVPQTLSKPVFILKPFLNDSQLKKIETILLRGSLKGNEEINGWTGANLMWGLFGTVNHALLFNDSEYLKKAVDRASVELEIKEGAAEGIKEDFTFFQHGPLNYIYGYGRSFMSDVANMMYLFSDTKYMFEDEKVKVFESLVLDGARYFQFNGYSDYQTVGREFSRKGYMRSNGMIAVLNAMQKTTEFTRNDEINAFLNELNGQNTENINKNYPISHTVISRTDNSFMSCKGVHTDYLCCEAGNHENYLSYNFFDGATLCLLHDGSEYYGLSPLMDFSLVPGVTAFADNDQTIIDKMGNYKGWVSNKGQTDTCDQFCNDDICGIGMKILRESSYLTGYTSRIFGDGCAVITGSDIYGLDKDKTVRTCINQTIYLGGDLNVGESKVLKKGESITMGGFVYTNLCDTGLCVEVVHVDGDWKRNNLDLQGDTTASGDVVKIYYDHGVRPNGASYAVSIREVEASADIKITASVEEQLHTLSIGDNEAVFDYFKDKISIDVK